MLLRSFRILASVMFWTIAEQGSTILALYADTRTNLNFMGIHISPAWFQSFNPLFIIVLAPVFAWIWIRLGDGEPSIPRSFPWTIYSLDLSFIVILVPGYFGGTDALVNPLWLVLSIFIVVLGNYVYRLLVCLQRRNWRLKLLCANDESLVSCPTLQHKH